MVVGGYAIRTLISRSALLYEPDFDGITANNVRQMLAITCMDSPDNLQNTSQTLVQKNVKTNYIWNGTVVTF